jgi:signal transduction histidine kinase
MSFVSLSIYNSHLEDEYQRNLKLVSNSILNNTCTTEDSQNMCTLCTLNKEFSAINIRRYHKDTEIPYKKFSKVFKVDSETFIQLSISDSYINTQLSDMKQILFYVFLIVSLFFTLIIYFLNKKLFTPLKSLVNFCHTMAIHEDIVPCHSNSYEIQELHKAILFLLDKNKALYEQKAHVFKEIAHEIKAPIAIIQARLSLLMDSTISEHTFNSYIEDTNNDIEDIKKLIYEHTFLHNS